MIESLIDELKELDDEQVNAIEEIKKEKPIKRNDVKITHNNHKNKQILRKEFNSRCCYCDDSDIYYGGINSFHVEHFAPKHLFPTLKYDYNNMLYACPLCNRAKWNKWVSRSPKKNVVNNIGFLNPCYEDYYKNIKRFKNGKIIPITSLGKYIYEETKLYLKKHEICYKLDKLQNIKSKLDLLIDSDIDTCTKELLKEIKLKVMDKFFDYYPKIND